MLLPPQTTAPRWLPILITAAIVLGGCTGKEAKSPRQQIIVYSSVDDEYARPLCERFSRASGIEVKLVPDSEETKSTGLLNRLIAEKDRPQADVFWSGDPVRAAVLQRKRISACYSSPQAAGLPPELAQPQLGFTAFSARMRVLIFNRNLLAGKPPPVSVLDLADPCFRGAACLANPLFGTTSMHAAALFQVMGEQPARDFFRRLSENRVAMLSSNGEVRRRVSVGDFAIGLTDSDDANVALKDNAPVGFVLPDQDGIGALLVPNAVALIDRCPNPENARKFIDFLLSPESEKWLAESDAAQIPMRAGLETPKFFGRSLSEIRLVKVDYGSLAAQLETLTGEFLEQWVAQQNDAPAKPRMAP